ncbi:MAG TPA: hypothetical protein VF816_16110 [Rhodocyclaceae bacterium]
MPHREPVGHGDGDDGGGEADQDREGDEFLGYRVVAAQPMRDNGCQDQRREGHISEDGNPKRGRRGEAGKDVACEGARRCGNEPQQGGAALHAERRGREADRGLAEDEEMDDQQVRDQGIDDDRRDR